MIIVIKQEAGKQAIEQISNKLREIKLQPYAFEGVERTVIHVLGDVNEKIANEFRQLDSVEQVVRIQKPYKLASKEHHQQKTLVKVGNVTLGNGEVIMMAGPCSIESEEQIFESARAMKKLGVKIMRASAFKPRTSPYAFQGMGIEGLKLLKRVKEETGLIVETEVMDVRDVVLASQYVDMLRIGARNMHNFDLLKEVGKVDKPIILKRGMSATIEEFLMAAEYIILHGNKNVILCERGIRTFETAYRNTLDLGAVAVLKLATHLPVIVDPSHAAGVRELVAPLSKAAVACGADGLIIETHPHPEKALSDGKQSLTPEMLGKLMEELRPICTAIGRKLG